MTGKPEVIERLRQAVNAEQTAAAQYTLDAAVLENAQIPQLAARSRQEAEEERTHLAAFLHRMTMLGAAPRVERVSATPGMDVPEIFARVAELERAAVELYSQAATEALAAGDHVTRDLFAGILATEEEHLNWVEAQIALIAEIGLENYIAAQMGGTPNAQIG